MGAHGGQRTIRVVGARQHNLRDLHVELPRGAITAFTGVSGSGKTSLVFDTIAAEAQRQLNETLSAFARNRLPTFGRPAVDEIANLSPVVVVGQRRIGGNARSTVGTITDTYSLLRLLFSRAGGPDAGPANGFSFNDPAGMCQECSGMGRVVRAATERFVDPERSLRNEAILLPGFRRGQYRYGHYIGFRLFDADLPVGEWSALERAALIDGGPAVQRLGKPVADDYEGLAELFVRLYIHSEDGLTPRKQKVLDRFSTAVDCPECGGARLNARARSIRVAGATIVECAAMEVAQLLALLGDADVGPAAPVAESLVARLRSLDRIGVGYLSLDRPTSSLSGGESQRIKLVRHLGNSLTEMIYVFDEPSVGLHPYDVERLVELLGELRDKGNTVLVVEHDLDVVAAADHVVELGPGAGAAGGEVVFQGTVEELATSGTATGRALTDRGRGFRAPRGIIGHLPVSSGDHNLDDVCVDFPSGVLTAITGVAGSGKSTLARALLRQYPGGTRVDQSPVATSTRSSTATYTGVAEPIRRLFARAHGVEPAMFSPNSAGACPRCAGLGVVQTDLAFMDAYSAVCEDCSGRRFTDEVLALTVDGRSIADVLDLDVDRAREVFDDRRIRPVLDVVSEVGLGYLALGQPLSSLSGGECQRLRLATELAGAPDGRLYVLDEPTAGLHPADVSHLVRLLDRLVERGATVVVVEHDLAVVRRADWVVDLGPGAGRHGGRVLFSGPPAELVGVVGSATAEHLARIRAV